MKSELLIGNPQIAKVERECVTYGQDIGLFEPRCRFVKLTLRGWRVCCTARLDPDDEFEAYSQHTLDFGHEIKPEDLKKHGIIGMEMITTLTHTRH